MQKKAQYTITLTMVSLLASLGVSSVFLLTKDTIKRKDLAVRTEALYIVLPGLEGSPMEVTPSEIADQDRVYKGLNKAGQLIGYAACGEAQGYSSKIKVMVGTDPGLEKIIGINILAQNETPGLGTKMTEVESTSTLWSVIFGKELKTIDLNSEESWQLPIYGQPERIKKFGLLKKEKKPLPWFQEQFKHKTYNQLVVSKVKDEEKITAITGATISTKAVINAVQNAIDKIKGVVQTPVWEIK
ncbi:MAG: FMN-binding protein [Candidatus Brocadia sp. AMX2]|uniref:Ion-translocating oxidoreductase complex subunit G n=1 Tax=Candidatus Brocadia sinica JPN1 TaxID=1197129 RepID=A0ABQ0JYS8_9BACT|nr:MULTISPECIES: FMN-binding protein [Brocadia]MBC6933609.1 FMN-binding protein [Candidatus Brocadia sp.]MBL1170441.1 FMN-binding protein [Candidatus Brocadia sp. AMX1]MCK6468606.1 FMN-binding protein [Candidatus Brocadia sinica]NOG40327.1 FMN-binding protein [Planctomycetota bacterium]KAA0241988.1 MAG: FMN-binding protein [Candidatus Brocadia sp. AMX2]